jgi:hypothetical protein
MDQIVSVKDTVHKYRLGHFFLMTLYGIQNSLHPNEFLIEHDWPSKL